MSVFDGTRLPINTFKLDIHRMRQGWYSDKYFNNIVSVLANLARQGYRFGGTSPDLSDIGRDLANISIGDIEVEMQWFTLLLFRVPVQLHLIHQACPSAACSRPTSFSNCLDS